MMNASSKLVRFFIVGFLSFIVSACAQDRGPAPILSVAQVGCLTEPDLGAAKALVVSDGEATPLEFLVSGASPCLETGESVRSLFELVRLPEVDAAFSIRVSAVPSSTGLFAPQLTILDADGIPLRQLPEEKYLFRGPKLTASARINAGERYLLIASNPERVGDRSQRTSAIINQYQSGGPIYFTVRTGSEFTKSVTYSHGGNVTVTGSFLDTSLDAR
ncbi:MAG: hypothetical protein ACFB0Z_11950 [Candidatus Phaeomarinobacter sp.]